MAQGSMLPVRGDQDRRVGGAADTATSLTNLGAREYQPGTGSFISPDPLLKPYDTQNLNAYAYAADNPSTYSDPSGAMLCDPDHTCGSVQALNNYAKAQTGDANHAQSSTANPKPKGYSPARSDSPMINRKVCESGRGCAPLRVFLNRPDETDPRPAPVLKTPPAHPVTNGRDASSCPMRVMETQIGFMLGGCAGEGVTTGINFSEPSDEGEHPGADTGQTDQGEGLTPGEGTKGLEDIEPIAGPNEFDPESLTGMTPEEGEERIPSDCVQESSKSGGGEVFRDPDHLGRQIRICRDMVRARDLMRLRPARTLWFHRMVE